MLHFLQRAGCAPASVLASARDAALAGALLVVTATCAQAQSPQTPGEPVVAVVRVPKPWYAPRALVVSRMRDTIPDYDKVPGLLFKAYSLGRDSGEFGGLYFWRSREQAQACLDEALARVLAIAGRAAKRRQLFRGVRLCTHEATVGDKSND